MDPLGGPGIWNGQELRAKGGFRISTMEGLGFRVFRVFRV